MLSSTENLIFVSIISLKADFKHEDAILSRNRDRDAVPWRGLADNDRSSKYKKIGQIEKFDKKSKYGKFDMKGKNEKK